MEIEYQPSADDTASLQEYFSKRMPERRRHRWIALGVLALVALGVLTWIAVDVTSDEPLFDPVEMISIYGILLVGLAIMFTLLLVGHNRSIVRNQVENAMADDPVRFRTRNKRIRVRVDEQGMLAVVDGCEEFLAWWRIPRVVTDIHTDCLFLFTLYSARQCLAIIVPRRAFDSEVAFADFCQRAEEHWRSAHDALIE